MGTIRIGAAIAAGVLFGVAIVIACGNGPKNANAQSTSERSSVAGTWNVTLTKTSGGYSCGNGALHLSGSDLSLAGAWACSTTSSTGLANSGVVTGDLVAGRLRLNLANNSDGTFLLVDAQVATDGKSASGTATGYTRSNGFATDYTVAITAQ